MVREFEIARTHGLTCLPIGATGSAAAELTDRLLGDSGMLAGSTIDVLKGLRNHRDNLSELIEPILKLADAVRGAG